LSVPVSAVEKGWIEASYWPAIAATPVVAQEPEQVNLLLMIAFHLKIRRQSQLQKALFKWPNEKESSKFNS
jgi:hypothetical protein